MGKEVNQEILFGTVVCFQQNFYLSSYHLKEEAPLPWPGGAVGCSTIPYTKGCRFDPWSGTVQEATHQYFSLALMFLAPPTPASSLSEINKHILR